MLDQCELNKKRPLQNIYKLKTLQENKKLQKDLLLPYNFVLYIF